MALGTLPLNSPLTLGVWTCGFLLLCITWLVALLGPLSKPGVGPLSGELGWKLLSAPADSFIWVVDLCQVFCPSQSLVIWDSGASSEQKLRAVSYVC